MSDVTAKVICRTATPVQPDTESEQVQLEFGPDYDDDRNKEWAKFTPGLSLTMTVKPEVAGHFAPGSRFTLTFTPEEA